MSVLSCHKRLQANRLSSIHTRGIIYKIINIFYPLEQNKWRSNPVWYTWKYWNELQVCGSREFLVNVKHEKQIMSWLFYGGGCDSLKMYCDASANLLPQLLEWKKSNHLTQALSFQVYKRPPFCRAAKILS